MIATGHQPNLLVGLSVVRKIAEADVFFCCDEFQFVRHGWVNRNKLADGTLLSVPFDHRDRYAPINRVRIGNDARWRDKLTKTLTMKIGSAAEPYVSIIERPWRLLAGLNVALRGIEVRYFDWEHGAPNHSAIELVKTREAVAA